MSLTKISTLVTIVGAITAGGWVLFLFVFTKYVEPRLSPAVVQVLSEAAYVGDSSCCHLYEVRTVLENKGHRETVIHASHQAVGARRIAIAKDLDKVGGAHIRDFRSARSVMGNTEYINRPTMQYVGQQPALPFLLISAGNLITPGAYLAPGERHTNLSVAAVPKDHILISIRGQVLVSHLKKDNDLDWRWTVDEESLEPIPLLWRRSESEALDRLSKCAHSSETFAERKQCLAQLNNGSMDLFNRVWTQDPHAYTQRYSADQFAVPHPMKLQE